MNQNSHSELVGFIWKIADLLRGPYRPPQYRRVMLPMIVLRRMDCVLEDTKDLFLTEYEKLKLQGYSQEVIDKILGNKTTGKREQPLYNISPFTFKKLLADPDNLPGNLMAHLVYTADEDVYEPGITRTICDPTCGTGGMLSVSEEYIRKHNKDANLILFGQEYNAESLEEDMQHSLKEIEYGSTKTGL